MVHWQNCAAAVQPMACTFPVGTPAEQHSSRQSLRKAAQSWTAELDGIRERKRGSRRRRAIVVGTLSGERGGGRRGRETGEGDEG